ncbi:nuclear transport factor 2 family protein [Streptomyces oryzae]|uniref:Nuclear transport factor 2 family protein n=1 Tax=Streptomyces oryzae TaxID=1434886 RepID=A0ABS3XDH6_9ACTN|nr:nuclear transport factor 2 family protein [Streptomyces oryzae]MBO8193442.1 nuclear transport factor 2 family protein [Streptomyces oryzae]
MSPFDATDPQRFIADFLTGFHDELLSSDEDAEVIVDRYHTPDIVQIADGHRIDRAKLVAHTRPIRKRRPGLRVSVHEALTADDRLAARYTLHAKDPKRELDIEVCFFGRFTPDGRMRQAQMLTRTIPAETEAAA